MCMCELDVAIFTISPGVKVRVPRTVVFLRRPRPRFRVHMCPFSYVAQMAAAAVPVQIPDKSDTYVGYCL
jgi:hypothetical protein